MKTYDEEQRNSQETDPKRSRDIENTFTSSKEENDYQSQELNPQPSEIPHQSDEFQTELLDSAEKPSAAVEIEDLSSNTPDLDISDVQGKVGQIFQNTVAATTSVAVVVVATPLFDNVNANFVELRLLENQIYYEVEVIERLGEDQEPANRPLRLIVENQFERIEVELEYGLNANVLNDLRPNTQYTFTVQMDKGIVWNTLVSERVRTASELAGIIGPATIIQEPSSRNVSLNVFTQAGGEEIQFYQFVVIDEGQAILTIPATEGEQTLNFELPLDNKSYRLELQAITAASELITLESRTFHPKAVFNSTVKYSYLYPHQILVQPTLVIDPLIDANYRLVLKENDQVIENLSVTGDLLLTVSPDTTYTLEWVVQYLDPRTNTSHTDVLATESLTTPPELFYIFQEIRRDESIQVIMQFENYNTLLDQTYVDIIDSAGNRTALNPLQFIASQFNTGLYEITFDESLLQGGSIEIGVILTLTPDLKVPLYQINP